jgi:phage-related protein
MIDATLKIDDKTQLDMGVVFEETDFTAKASQNYRQVEVEGLNGASYSPFNYEDVKRQIPIQLLDLTKESAVYAWLDGEKTLEYKDKVTTVRFYESFALERESSIKTGKVNFIRDPFWYKKIDNYITVTNEVENEGTVYSEPIIRLEKGVDSLIDLTIGNVRFSYDFGDDTYVEIDCQSAKVTYEGLSRFNQINIGYDLPKLQVGKSSITVHSGDAVIKIKRKDRWL